MANIKRDMSIDKIQEILNNHGIGGKLCENTARDLLPLLSQAEARGRESVVEMIEKSKLLGIAKYGNMPAPYDPTYKEGYNQALSDLLTKLKEEK